MCEIYKLWHKQLIIYVIYISNENSMLNEDVDLCVIPCQLFSMVRQMSWICVIANANIVSRSHHNQNQWPYYIWNRRVFGIFYCCCCCRYFHSFICLFVCYFVENVLRAFKRLDYLHVRHRAIDYCSMGHKLRKLNHIISWEHELQFNSNQSRFMLLLFSLLLLFYF